MEIHSFGPAITPECYRTDYELDQHNNKVYNSNWEKINRDHCPEQIKGAQMAKIFTVLVNKIKENTNLFCEHFMSKIEMEDIKNCHLHLIIQQLRYWSLELLKNWSTSSFRHFGCGVLVMDESIPFLGLGTVTTMLIEYDHVILRTTKETAALCNLFTQLCHDSGLEQNISLACVKEHQYGDNLMYKDFNYVRGVGDGTTGVVTAQSDVDSAVDAFLASSATSPWRLNEVLVQASVLSRFKNSIQSKCDMNTSSQYAEQEELSDIRDACDNVYVFKNKVLAIESNRELPEVSKNTQLVSVETYLTTKELMSLLNENNPFYVSVWSNDIAEANEISLGISAPMVWVNQFSTFTGPPKVSQPLYATIAENYCFEYVESEFEVVREKWAALDYEERRELVLGVLEVYVHREGSSDSVAKRLLDTLQRDVCDDFVEVRDDTICLGIDQLIGVIGRYNIAVDENYFFNAVKSVLLGNSLVYSDDCSIMTEALCIIHEFKEADIPVTSFYHQIPNRDTVQVQVSDALNFFKTKVIITKYGRSVES